MPLAYFNAGSTSDYMVVCCEPRVGAQESSLNQATADVLCNYWPDNVSL